ncbi:hypothetical protein [Streptomyces cupreus]|uniref:Uncharacterized protein n=1 Tax=Streptomyces cupreus TaxID=2759956 RepID=A0A7X1J9K9_9ACTN|nr:hypothetical protein [Streptomyces cupreus]MBC2906746.1 hypothetical protein [Streptomyces cupreus]
MAALPDAAHAATHHKVEGSAALEYKGGGVYLYNQPGYYYMGRLFERQDFYRHSTSKVSSKKYRSRSGTYVSKRRGRDLTYRWGYADGTARTCLWIGPSAGDRKSIPYLSRKLSRTKDRCSQWRVDWLTDRKNIGRRFNCGENRARGPQKTKITRDATLYYNLNWRGDYSGGPGKNPAAGKLEHRKQVWYRYTTKDGRWAVIYDKDKGWGFVEASKVRRVRGRWSFAGEAKSYRCGEHLLKKEKRKQRPQGTRASLGQEALGSSSRDRAATSAAGTSAAVQAPTHAAAQCHWQVQWGTAGVYEKPFRDPGNLIKTKHSGDIVGPYCFTWYNQGEQEYYVAVHSDAAADDIGWMRLKALSQT